MLQFLFYKKQKFIRDSTMDTSTYAYNKIRYSLHIIREFKGYFNPCIQQNKI